MAMKTGDRGVSLGGWVVGLVLFGCAVQKQDLATGVCENRSKGEYVQAAAIQNQIDSLVKEGVPGVSMSIYSNGSSYGTSAGVSKIEGNVPMGSCNLMYLQSVAKTYMSVAILQLYEQGKINLDAPMTEYLPAKYNKYIRDGNKVTVRMLLNHTSGIPEYNSVPSYVTRLLQHPSYPFTVEEYLQSIEGKPLTYEPGSRYSYRNTNFVLLALIGDAITGDHAAYIVDHIFKPLDLKHTFYRGQSGYLEYPELANAYWDRYSNSILENASVLQRNNVAALIGDDGIVATAEDAVKFLRGLMEGKLIKPETLTVMKSWVNDRKGSPTYGLGLDYSILGGKTALGHSGGGIGAGCQLYYFPDDDLYVFIGINLGTVTESPIHAAAQKRLDKIYKILLNGQ